MKYITIIVLWSFGINVWAQADLTRYRFDHIVMTVEGDLNKDRLPDKVVVSQDTLDEFAPYQLEIFFRETNGQF